MIPNLVQISLVQDSKTSKPRGYAFIEYEHERDMHCKYTDDSRKEEAI